jgi:hypothetical protein
LFVYLWDAQTGGKTLDPISVIAPAGAGCSDATECPWNQSCTTGRDVTIPFCGACLPGFSEAFGASECIPQSECGSIQAYGALTSATLLGFLYVIFKSSRPETPSGNAYAQSYVCLFDNVRSIHPIYE